MKTSFDPKTHSYLIDGKPATGVTTVIDVLAKPALIGWAAKMSVEFVKENGEYDGETEEYTISGKLLEEAKSAHTKKKEAAGEHGTSSHSLVEDSINFWLEQTGGKPVGLAAEDDPIKRFKDWAIKNVDHFLFAERRMFDSELFVAGTADFAYVGKDGQRYMADFKTSSGIYGIDYWLQVAAYRMLAEGEGDAPYDGAVVVRMGKDGAFEVQKRFDYILYKEAFLACLKLYRLQAHNKGATITTDKSYPAKN